MMLLQWAPILFLIGLWIFIMRQMQTGGNRAMAFGKSKAKLLTPNQKKVTFKDVAGCDESKAELSEIIDFLKEPGKFQKLGGKIPKGVLMMGPPGTGKTLLARAVAGEANVPFFSISGSDFVEMFVGVGASRVRDLFEQGKKNAPCIIFIDEIDAVGRHRGAGLGGGHDEREQTLNALLVEMDGFEGNDGVILIAATNRPDVLDPALLRPGRFDRRVVVDRPDVKGREGILKVHVKNIPMSDDVDLFVVARGTPGFAGADLANLVNEAALTAARADKKKVEMDDFNYAKDKVLMGAERKSMVMSDKEKRNTAYHEGGHALIAAFEEHADPLHKVTIIPRGRALGLTQQLPLEDKYSYSKEYVEARLAVMMGGRLAEEVCLDQITTGASNDFEQATTMARRMVCEWGMSDLGPMTFGHEEGEVFLGKRLRPQARLLRGHRAEDRRRGEPDRHGGLPAGQGDRPGEPPRPRRHRRRAPREGVPRRRRGLRPDRADHRQEGPARDEGEGPGVPVRRPGGPRDRRREEGRRRRSRRPPASCRPRSEDAPHPRVPPRPAPGHGAGRRRLPRRMEARPGPRRRVRRRTGAPLFGDVPLVPGPGASGGPAAWTTTPTTGPTSRPARSAATPPAALLLRGPALLLRRRRPEPAATAASGSSSRRASRSTGTRRSASASTPAPCGASPAAAPSAASTGIARALADASRALAEAPLHPPAVLAYARAAVAHAERFGHAPLDAALAALAALRPARAVRRRRRSTWRGAATRPPGGRAAPRRASAEFLARGAARAATRRSPGTPAPASRRSRAGARACGLARLRTGQEPPDDRSPVLRLGSRELRFGPVASVMAILNVTPDSFSDGGVHAATAEPPSRRGCASPRRARRSSTSAASRRARAARPTAAAPARSRSRRSSPASSRSSRGSAPRTRRSRSPSTRGGPRSPGAPSTREPTSSTSSRGSTRPTGSSSSSPGRDAAIVLNHMRGVPSTTFEVSRFGPDVVADVAGDLARARRRCLVAGIRPDRIFLDPGLGFGKTPDQNFALLAGLALLAARGGPDRRRRLAEGVPRHRSRASPPAERLPESLAACAVAARDGSGAATRSSSASTTSRRRSGSSRSSGAWAPRPRVGATPRRERRGRRAPPRRATSGS